jgi:copper ion binding protein
MPKQILTVEGMSCNHCKEAVEKAVRALPGVTVAAVDLAAKKLEVEYDETVTSLEQLKAAVDDAGFTVL